MSIYVDCDHTMAESNVTWTELMTRAISDIRGQMETHLQPDRWSPEQRKEFWSAGAEAQRKLLDIAEYMDGQIATGWDGLAPLDDIVS